MSDDDSQSDAQGLRTLYVYPSERRRPFVVALMAGMCFLLGGLGLRLVGKLLLRADARETLTEAMSLLGMVPYAVFGALLLVHVLQIVVGVGLWTGSRWGWWLGFFYFAHRALQKLLSFAFAIFASSPLVDVPLVANEFSASINSWAIIEFVSCIAWLGYLLLPEAVVYFRVAQINQWKALGMAAVASVVYSGLFLAALMPWRMFAEQGP